jgi:hypothetical protein
VNSLDDLPLLSSGEFGEVESLTLHLNLAGSTQVEFIVDQKRDRGQQRDNDQHM